MGVRDDRGAEGPELQSKGKKEGLTGSEGPEG